MLPIGWKSSQEHTHGVSQSKRPVCSHRWAYGRGQVKALRPCVVRGAVSDPPGGQRAGAHESQPEVSRHRSHGCALSQSRDGIRRHKVSGGGNKFLGQAGAISGQSLKDTNNWMNITFEGRPTSISVTAAGILLVGLESGKVVVVANKQPVRTFVVSPPAGPQNVTAPLGMKMSADRQGNMVVVYGRTGEVFFATPSGRVVTTDVCHGEVLSVCLGPMGHWFVVGADGVVLHRLSRFLLPPDIKPVDGFGPETPA